jgi:hypothetical protein
MMDRIRIAVPTRHAAKPEGAEQFISVSIWPNTDLWRRIVKPQPQRRANHRKRCDYERKRKNEIHPDRSTSQKIFAPAVAQPDLPANVLSNVGKIETSIGIRSSEKRTGV